MGKLSHIVKAVEAAKKAKAENTKAFDEHLSGMQTAYHSTKEGTKISKWSTKPAYGRVWFTDSLDAINSGAVGAQGKGKTYQVYFDKNAKWATSKEADNSYTDQLIADGYDGIRHEDSSGEYGNYFEVFNPKVIKSKAQIKKEFEQVTNLAKQKGVTNQQALTMLMGGGAIGAGMQSQEAEAGMMGVMSKTFNPKALNKAKEMKIQGASRDEIWKATGEQFGTPTYLDVDGKWKQEFDDSGAAYMPDVYDKPLGDSYSHDNLYNAYPDIRNIPLEKEMGEDLPYRQYAEGVYNDEMDTIKIKDTKGSKSGKSVLSHEIQHAIQQREGFATGGNPNDMVKVLDEKKLQSYIKKDDSLTAEFEALKSKWANTPQSEIPADVVEKIIELRKNINTVRNKGWKESQSTFHRTQWTPDELFKGYQSLSGEAEARNVQHRMNMSMPERIATPPWATLKAVGIDNEEDLIVRGQRGQATTKQLSGVAAGISTLAAAPLAYQKFKQRRDARVKGVADVGLTMASGTVNDMLLSAGALGTRFRQELADGFQRQGMTGAESFVRPEQNQEQFYNQNVLPQYMPQTEEGMGMIQGLGNVMNDTVDYWKDKPLVKYGVNKLGQVEKFANENLGEDNVRSLGHVINLLPF